MPTCDGEVVIVRVSRIKPSGSLKGFMDAAAAHEAWYRANGFKDNQIRVARVITTDPATKTMKYSDTEVLSYHVRPPQRPANADDATWKAYVKQYQDNSEADDAKSARFFVALHDCPLRRVPPTASGSTACSKTIGAGNLPVKVRA